MRLLKVILKKVLKWLVIHICMMPPGPRLCICPGLAMAFSFSAAVFSFAAWVGGNLVRLFCTSRKSFSPALFYIHTKKKPNQNKNEPKPKPTNQPKPNQKIPQNIHTYTHKIKAKQKNLYKQIQQQTRNQNCRYIKSFCEQRTNMKYPWKRKKLYCYTSLFRICKLLNLLEVQGSSATAVMPRM